MEAVLRKLVDDSMEDVDAAHRALMDFRLLYQDSQQRMSTLFDRAYLELVTRQCAQRKALMRMLREKCDSPPSKKVCPDDRWSAAVPTDQFSELSEEWDGHCVSEAIRTAMRSAPSASASLEEREINEQRADSQDIDDTDAIQDADVADDVADDVAADVADDVARYDDEVDDVDCAVNTSVAENAVDDVVASDAENAMDDVENGVAVVEDVAADETVEDAVVEDAAVEDAAVEDAAVEDAAVEDAAVEDAVVEDAAVEDAVVEDAAVEDAVVEDAAVEDAAVEDAAVEDAVVEDAVVEDAVVEDVVESEDAAEYMTIEFNGAEYYIASSNDVFAPEDLTTPIGTWDGENLWSTYRDEDNNVIAYSEFQPSENTHLFDAPGGTRIGLIVEGAFLWPQEQGGFAESTEDETKAYDVDADGDIVFVGKFKGGALYRTRSHKGQSFWVDADQKVWNASLERIVGEIVNDTVKIFGPKMTKPAATMPRIGSKRM